MPVRRRHPPRPAPRGRRGVLAVRPLDQEGSGGQDAVPSVAASARGLGRGQGLLARGPDGQDGEPRGHRAFAALAPGDLGELFRAGFLREGTDGSGRGAVAGQGPVAGWSSHAPGQDGGRYAPASGAPRSGCCVGSTARGSVGPGLWGWPGPGPLRGPHLARLAPPRHPRHCRPGLAHLRRLDPKAHATYLPAVCHFRHINVSKMTHSRAGGSTRICTTHPAVRHRVREPRLYQLRPQLARAFIRGRTPR